MRRISIGMIGVAVMGYSSVAYADKADAFLDRPIPAGVKIDSFWSPAPDGKGAEVEYHGLKMGDYASQVRLLGQLSGKKMVLPTYVASALTIKDDKANTGSWGSWGVEKNQQVRSIFNRICLSMGMAWRYEPQRDDIVLDMDWRRDDSRSSAKLVNILNHESPIGWEKLPPGPVNIVGGHGRALDAWRIAFDALLSKPKNLSTAGQVRVYHDSHGLVEMCPFPVLNMFSQKMQDSSGKEETLVLNGQLPMNTEAPPCDVAYYLFDEEGKFIEGGVYTMGEGTMGGVDGAKADSKNRVTIDVAWGMLGGLKSNHAHFRLKNGNLVLTGATDSEGHSMTAEEARTRVQQGQSPAPSARPINLVFTLDPGASHPVTPGPPSPPSVKPIHGHGAMGVLKFSVVGPGAASSKN